MNILLIGKTGQIGGELAKLLPELGTVMAIGREEVDQLFGSALGDLRGGDERFVTPLAGVNEHDLRRGTDHGLDHVAGGDLGAAGRLDDLVGGRVGVSGLLVEATRPARGEHEDQQQPVEKRHDSGGTP